MRCNKLPRLIVVAVLAAIVHADDPAPVALQPGRWLGVDGNWSTVQFSVGSTAQEVNVLVSTWLSEFWTIGPGGCNEGDQTCITRRGGIFTPEDSSTWSPLDFWELGLEHLGFGGNGEYGLDTITAQSSITDATFTMGRALLASVNTTDYFEGLFGLGITAASFGNRVAESPLTQAVRTYGHVPSYSYGYTAGAHYRNMPSSVTLGGYDSTRFVPHSNQFTLTRSDNSPRLWVRGIEATVPDADLMPDGWSGLTSTLSTFNDSFIALIDSSTPHLWLPGAVCDRFAEALDLTYNDTMGIYTISNNQYNNFMSSDSLSFTFSISSPDNADDLGSPLDVPGVVNITLTSQALVSLLHYPFGNGALNYGDPAVPSFSLRRAPGNSTFIIGRAFLQESYLITKYDEQSFSLHQASFPDDPIGEAEIVPIEQVANSPYPPPASRSSEADELTHAEKAGISIGVILGVSLATFSLWWWYLYPRWKKSRKPSDGAFVDDLKKDSTFEDDSNTPKSAFSRILSMANPRKQSRRSPPGSSGVMSTTTCPSSPSTPHEAPDSEIHELPTVIPPTELPSDSHAQLGSRTVTIPPAELDASDDYNSPVTDEDVQMSSTETLSAYELSRRKMERQLQGPLPEYTPPENGVMPPPEKLYPWTPGEETRREPREDLRAEVQYTPPPPPPPPTEPSPVMVATAYPSAEDGTYDPYSPLGTFSLPSPLSPNPIYTGHPSLPSTESDTFLSAVVPPTNHTQRRSVVENHLSPPSKVTMLQPPPKGGRRTIFNPSDVVRVGPLRDNAQLSRHSLAPQSYAFQSRETSTYNNRATWTPQPSSPGNMERIDADEDFIHVPQPAARKFSWEEDRGPSIGGAAHARRWL